MTARGCGGGQLRAEIPHRPQGRDEGEVERVEGQQGLGATGVWMHGGDKGGEGTSGGYVGLGPHQENKDKDCNWRLETG